MAYFSPIVLGFAFFLAECGPEAIDGWSTRAAQAYRAGRISEARSLYERTLQADGRHTAALTGLGRIDLLEHRRRSAMKHLALAYQTNPNDPAVVRAYAAAAEDERLEGILLERLRQLPAASSEDKAHAGERLELLNRLGGRVINRLLSGYRAYHLRMPVAQGSDGRVHGWTLRVSLNGKRPLRLLLDTGSRGILINRHQAASLDLEPLTKINIGGFGGGPAQPAQLMLAPQARINGELAFANVLVEVGRNRMVEGVDGLIGTDLLRHFLVTCDGPKRQLVLTPFEDSTGEEGAGGHPWARWEASTPGGGFDRVRRLGHLLLVEDRTAKHAQWVLDTGAGYSIAHDDLPSLIGETVSLVGVSGSAAVRRKEQPLRYNITGTAAFTRDVVTTDLDPLSRHYGVRLAGFLGFPVLRNKVITLDARDGTLRVGSH